MKKRFVGIMVALALGVVATVSMMPGMAKAESGVSGSGSSESGAAARSSDTGGGSGASLTEAQLAKIANRCESIRETLVDVQHNDSRARVYLGRYYETMLSGFITPLNVWLVGQNLSNVGLIENQNDFAAARGDFVNDYIAYQKDLEELVATNCATEPKGFYEKLVRVRKSRAQVANDVARLRKLMGRQTKLVGELKEKL